MNRKAWIEVQFLLEPPTSTCALLLILTLLITFPLKKAIFQCSKDEGKDKDRANSD